MCRVGRRMRTVEHRSWLRARVWGLSALLLAVSMVVAACENRAEGEPPHPREPLARRLQVMTTNYPLYEFAGVVGGDRVDVALLLPPGMEAHDFDPTPRDIERIARADLLLYNGAGFEPWIDRALPALATGAGGPKEAGGPRAVDVTAAVALPDVEGEVVHDHEEEGRPDPHVWLDPRQAAGQVRAILTALTGLDPGGQAYYAENAGRYLDELAGLDREFAAGLKDCARRDLVVQHAAFNHLARRYGLRQVAISGLSHEMEPTPRQMAELVAFARERGVRAIFAETLVDSRVAGVLAAEAGATLLSLHPIENLTAGELTRGETYLSLMRGNLDNLRRGLGCGGSGS